VRAFCVAAWVLRVVCVCNRHQSDPTPTAVRSMLRRIAADVVAKRALASPSYDTDEPVVRVSAVDRMDCGVEVRMLMCCVRV
jgi:hypothetical protein